MTLFSRPLAASAVAPDETYEVSLLKKLPRYQPDTGTVSVIEHEWVYSTIVSAVAPGLAVYEALHEYFAWRLAKKWQTRRRLLTRRDLTLVDLFARDLAESAMRRAGTPSQMIHAIVTPWEPGCITLHFLARP
ncbi:MAG: hypothetical protein E6Q06_01195 [Candidatus Moraniibacteriota bacterium]|nr:MAG: hypothetical protein E6Q06_01195 [Candidatus Moranbacteria bacterium]